MGLSWGRPVVWVHLWASGGDTGPHSNGRKAVKMRTDAVREVGCVLYEKMSKFSFLVMCAGYYCSVKGFF